MPTSYAAKAGTGAALGYVRLADLRESHIRDVHAAMRKLNKPSEQG